MAHHRWHTSDGTPQMAHLRWYTTDGTPQMAHHRWHTTDGTPQMAHLRWHTSESYHRDFQFFSFEGVPLNKIQQFQYTTNFGDSFSIKEKLTLDRLADRGNETYSVASNAGCYQIYVAYFRSVS